MLFEIHSLHSKASVSLNIYEYVYSLKFVVSNLAVCEAHARNNKENFYVEVLPRIFENVFKIRL